MDSVVKLLRDAERRWPIIRGHRCYGLQACFASDGSVILRAELFPHSFAEIIFSTLNEFWAVMLQDGPPEFSFDDEIEPIARGPA